jgi:cyclic beta-1,2-glucan synthetase
MQRAGVESILGMRIEDAVMRLNPCIPRSWPRFEMSVRWRSARYEIQVGNPSGVARGVLSATVDGRVITERPLRLALLDDGGEHRVEVTLG